MKSINHSLCQYIMNKYVVAPLCSWPLNQERCLPMSNFDFLLLPEINYVSILCYENPAMPRGSPPSASIGNFIGNLKKSMAQVLAPFYPLAGEVVYNTVGEPEILCNNRGVDFIEAYADVELKNLNLHNFDMSFVVGKLVPKKKRGVLTVQVSIYYVNIYRIMVCKCDDVSHVFQNIKTTFLVFLGCLGQFASENLGHGPRYAFDAPIYSYTLFEKLY
ncbi:hypothetical protein CsatB_028257 [Cannabis sativa]